ncbi:MAG: hypothetical protein HY454_01605 [Parcubacteria group bacterium]|nr:hypothetical protein [Parcubacteria group bacterium]
MIKQGDAGRFEEYITLRQEMLELHSFCRQILYWTVALVIAGLGWYLALLQSQNPASIPIVSGSLFAILLLVALFLSFVVYNRYLLLIFRVGSFIAVFWESRDPERGLMWHRCNRKTPSILEYRPQSLRGFVLSTAVIIYIILVFTILVIFEFFGVGVSSRAQEWVKWSLVLLDVTAFCSSVGIIRYLTREYEKDWIKIRASPELQDTIHSLYGDVSLPLSPP